MKFLFSVFCTFVFSGLLSIPALSASQGYTAWQGNSIMFIEPDTTTTLRLDGQTPTILAYMAGGGETVTVTARALGEGTIEGLEGTYTLDPVIEILSPDGERLAYNDDHYPDGHHGTTLENLTVTDSAIERLLLSEAATYTIRVNTFNGVTVGDVEISLALVSPVEYDIVTDEADTLIMNVRLNAAQIFEYPFTAEAGTIYTIVARDPKGLLDPIITLRENEAENNVIASNDDYRYRFGDAFILNVFDARIVDAEIPSDGGHVLELREFMGRGGEITVQIVARKP